MNEPLRPMPCEITPPFPASYLQDVATFPDDLLVGERRQYTDAEHAQVRRIMRTLKADLFFFRKQFEREHNVTIVSEPPLAP